MDALVPIFSFPQSGEWEEKRKGAGAARGKNALRASESAENAAARWRGGGGAAEHEGLQPTGLGKVGGCAERARAESRPAKVKGPATVFKVTFKRKSIERRQPAAAAANALATRTALHSLHLENVKLKSAEKASCSLSAEMNSLHTRIVTQRAIAIYIHTYKMHLLSDPRFFFAGVTFGAIFVDHKVQNSRG